MDDHHMNYITKLKRKTLDPSYMVFDDVNFDVHNHFLTKKFQESNGGYVS
jgi:hypothetical protein